MRRFSFLLLLTQVYAYSLCQEIVTIDTVVAASDSVVVQKTVIIHDTTNVRTLAIGYFIETFIAPEYWQLADDMYNNSFGMTGGINQAIVINKYLLQVGVSLSSYKNSFAYNYVNISISTETRAIIDTLNVHYYIVNGDSIPEAVTETRYEDVDVSKVTNYHESGTFSYNAINIPLSVGYRMRGKYMAYHFKAGMIGHVLTATKGNYFDVEQDTITPFSQTVKRHLSFSYMCSIGIEYPYSEHMSVFIEPYYYRNINSFFKQEQSVFKQFSGCKIGLQYWF